MSWTGASLYLDLAAGTGKNLQGWTPQVQLYYPTFTEEASVYIGKAIADSD